MVKELDGLLQSIKNAVGQSQGILLRWQHDVMFERKEGRVARYDELGAAMRDLIAARHTAVTGEWPDDLGGGSGVVGCLSWCRA